MTSELLWEKVEIKKEGFIEKRFSVSTFGAKKIPSVRGRF